MQGWQAAWQVSEAAIERSTAWGERGGQVCLMPPPPKTKKKIEHQPPLVTTIPWKPGSSNKIIAALVNYVWTTGKAINTVTGIPFNGYKDFV